MVNSTCKRIIAFWLIKTVNTSNNKTARISCSFSSPSITPDHDRIDCVHRITTGNRLSLRDTQQPSSIVRIPFDFHACAKRGIPYRAKRHRSFGRKRRKKEKSCFIIDTEAKDFKTQAFLERDRSRNRAFEDADVREPATSIESGFSWLCAWTRVELLGSYWCPSVPVVERNIPRAQRAVMERFC